MKINSFKAAGVHGYLKFDINFYSEMTFLIGINGSGKTSALKLILGLLSPSYNYLNQITYDFCEVNCLTNRNQKIVIRSKQDINKGLLTVSLKIDDSDIQTSIPIGKCRRPEESYDIEELSLTEQSLKEKFDSQEVVRKIRELETPKFLGLDRRIYEGSSIDASYNIKNRRYLIQTTHRSGRQFENYPEPPAIDTSLFQVQALIYEYFRKIAQQQPAISEEFKRKIFQQSFQFISEQRIGIEQIPDNETSIDDRKEKVLAAINELGINYLEWDVNSFFKKINSEIITKNKKIQDKKNTNKSKNKNIEMPDREEIELLSMWFYNSQQLKRIDEIIRYSEEYQKKIIELRDPIKRLEKIVSNFFKEGRKVLTIGSDGEIKVKLLENERIASIYELSSGEKQVLIMIAHLIFEEDRKPSGIFIIDEPELSLHIAWQTIFVDSITEASPKTQFILATHSPSIVSKVEREKFCQDINKLNV